MGTRYNYSRRKKSPKLKITLAIILIIIIVIVLVVVISRNKNKGYDPNKMYYSSSDFTSIREIIEYYGNEYLSEKKLKNDQYKFIVYTKFKHDLYENEESNETFFYQVVNQIATFSEYSNFEIIDNSKDITIKVLCKNQKVSIIEINGDTNYFKTMDTNLALKKYNSRETTEMNIQSEILNSLIKNDWIAKNVEFGEKESTYDKYDIYFDEGIKVRTISGKVFNIVFTNNYKKNIINNISVSTEEYEIKELLGTPTYEDIVTGTFGYKGEDVYVFFCKEEISVYRVEKDYDTLEFIKLIKKYNDNKDAKELGNDLTYLWDDYDEYNYDTNYVELTYSLKGVKMQFNRGNPNGFILYSNYSGLVTEDKYIYEVTDKSELLKRMYIDQENLVFKREQERSSKEYFKYTVEGELSEDELENINKPFRIDYILNEDSTYSKVKFISMKKEYADSELDEHLTINNYIWKDDFNIIYSVKNTGIYMYNCETRKLTTIITGNDEFKIEGLQNNKLKYDNKEIEI